MKKSLLYCVCYVLLSFCMTGLRAAENDAIYLGYCDGKIASATEGGVIGKSGSGTVECAIKIPKSDLTGYLRNRISSIRVGMPSAAVTSVSVWIRTSLTGANIAEGSCDTVGKGWNDIALTEVWNIVDTADVYVGFAFSQTKKINCISLVGQVNDEGSWVGLNGKWSSNVDKNIGSLSIEAVVTGDYLPQYNLGLLSSALTSEKAKVGLPFTLIGTVKNFAAKTVEGYVIKYAMGDYTTGQVAVTQTLAYGETGSFSVELPTTGVPVVTDCPLTITLALADGSDDESMIDNVIVLAFNTFDNAYSRKVVLEEFTTESCPNCPPGIERIKSAIRTSNVADQVIWICHHSGYYTDLFTIPASESYLWFFGGNGTFAPAVMFDRFYNPIYSYNGTPICNVGYSTTISAFIESELADPVFVEPTVTAEYADDKVYIHVTCSKYDTFDGICPAPYLTVMLKEDNVAAISQSGAGSGFMHENVLRAVATDVWGDAITWAEGTYTADYVVDLKSGWKTADMSAVAFVHANSTTNRNGCTIYNAAASALTPSSGIARIDASADVVREVYTSLDGAVIDAARAHGFSLKTTTYSDGRVETTKVLLP